MSFSANRLFGVAMLGIALGATHLIETTWATLTININPTTALGSNQAALDAFERAADSWEALFTDDITVNIDANLASFGTGNQNIIGSALSSVATGPLNGIRDAMVADAASEPDDGIVANLAGFNANQFALPTGVTIEQSSGVNLGSLNTANAKALGLITDQSITDALISFNSDFSFDYDNSNGVTPGTIDFETVAAHEIGHALGFTSEVDDIDNGETAIEPNPMDFFRFEAGNEPTNALEFTTNDRLLEPGTESNFSDVLNEWAMSTGVNDPDGDGRQASHWKDNNLTGTLIGILDPTLSFGVEFPITFADVRALDLIGYDIIVIPEASQLICGLSLIGLWGISKNRGF